jgi:hypothetical protein
MATNLPNQSLSTQQFFNGYYNQQITMNTDVYNQIYSFFINNTASTSAAQQLTQTVMILTYNNGIDPLNVIKEFNRAANQSELKILLITFFNSLRGPTSKLGFNNNTFGNQWIQRNIIA